jgi:hypothetical protein
VRHEELATCLMRGIIPDPRDCLHDQTYLLTEGQRQRLRTFECLFKVQGCPMSRNVIYNLSDDPDYTVGWSLRHLSIPAYRLNTSAFWIPMLGRCMTVRERLASLGWPVYDSLASAGSLPVVNFPDRDLAKTALGNSVCLPNLGVALLCGLACCKRCD